MVLFKNIHIWPKNGAHAHIWAYIFWPIGLIFFGNSGDYYQSISVRNPSYDAYFLFFGHFWREHGRGHQTWFDDYNCLLILI